MEDKVKQLIIMRTDLGMRKGKMVAQGSHASLGAILQKMPGQVSFDMETGDRKEIKILYLDSSEPLGIWLAGSFFKICVGVGSEEELLQIRDKLEENKIEYKLIQDLGHTEFHGVPTYTCLATEPHFSSVLDPICGHLKLL